MKIVFMGTGTSHGVPMIGCNCPVCRSKDPKNKRTRSSVYIEANGTRLLIDTPPELRLQALRENIKVVDAILFTHAHADHLFGLDDVRRFNEIAERTLPVYGNAETLSVVRRAFDYVFRPLQLGGGLPSIELVEVDGSFRVGETDITPVPVLHGRVNVLGYKIGRMAYVTDCSEIPETSRNLLYGLDLLILGVLRPKPHATHFSLSQGLAVVEQLKPKRALFTHIAHRMEHEAISRSLPPNVGLAYDGLRVML